MRAILAMIGLVGLLGLAAAPALAQTDGLPAECQCTDADKELLGIVTPAPPGPPASATPLALAASQPFLWRLRNGVMVPLGTELITGADLTTGALEKQCHHTDKQPCEIEVRITEQGPGTCTATLDYCRLCLRRGTKIGESVTVAFILKTSADAKLLYRFPLTKEKEGGVVLREDDGKSRRQAARYKDHFETVELTEVRHTLKTTLKGTLLRKYKGERHDVLVEQYDSATVPPSMTVCTPVDPLIVNTKN